MSVFHIHTDVLCFAGTEKHELTSWKSFQSIFKFFSNALKDHEDDSSSSPVTTRSSNRIRHEDLQRSQHRVQYHPPLVPFLLCSFSEKIFLLEALLPVYCMTLRSAGSGCIHQNSVLHYFWMSATVKAIWLHCLCLLWAAVWIWWWPIGGQIKADRRRRTPPLDAPLIILTLS